MKKSKFYWKTNKKAEKIGLLLEEYMNVNGFSKTVKEIEIVRNWPEIVGEKVAAFTECREIENGVLKVKVESSVWRQELSYNKRELIIKISDFCGTGIVRDINFL